MTELFVKDGAMNAGKAKGTNAMTATGACSAVAEKALTSLKKPVVRTCPGMETFRLANIGESITEATLTEWFVKEGQMMKEMENVCAVANDEFVVLQSPYTGKVLKLYAKTQDVVKVGSPLIGVEVASTHARNHPTAVAAAASRLPPMPKPAGEERASGHAECDETPLRNGKGRGATVVRSSTDTDMPLRSHCAIRCATPSCLTAVSPL